MIELTRRVSEQSVEIVKLRAYADFLERQLRDARARLEKFRNIEESTDRLENEVHELNARLIRAQDRNGRLKRRAQFWKRVASFRHRPARRRRDGGA